MDLLIRKRCVENYVRQHPSCTDRDIRRDLKMKAENTHGSMRKAYAAAGILFSKHLRKRSPAQQRQEAIDFIRCHPGCTVTEIRDNVRVCIPRVFGSIAAAYRLAGIKYTPKTIDHGVRSLFVVTRSHSYEREVLRTLGQYGTIISHVRCTAGIADAVFIRDGQQVVIEVKDFRARNNITMSQIKQLDAYMNTLQIRRGLLICPEESFPVKKNTRDITLGKNYIKIVSLDEVKKIWA